MSSGERLRIEGVVQGVGFRPLVWRLARAHGLDGTVRNEGGGVVAELWGDPLQREAFLQALVEQLPPLARIESLTRTPLSGTAAPADFSIETSRRGVAEAGLGADAALCEACLGELHDPQDRRYRYPFINCTHCGPRLTITRALPYDREQTSMAPFPLCPECGVEYDSPETRRFHAQATACPQCGPRLWLSSSNGETLASGEAIERAVVLLLGGAIIAIKGIGGFHLACDAANEAAVQRLRQGKRRPHKPFAVMVTDIAMARRIATVSVEEAGLLQSPAAPIVLLDALAGGLLAPAVAPGLDTIGVMLAYSGLHRLLLEQVGRPLVMSSGNRSGEPLLADNAAALHGLAGVADYFLLHDREIVQRLDDSVVRLIAGAPRLLRRARGYVPQAITLPAGFEQGDGILAMGAEMKGSFCMVQRGRALVSPYLGELGALGNFEHYRQTLGHYARLFGFSARRIAIDPHPDYHATRHGIAMAEGGQLPLTQVQHHHAHIAACMAEHGMPLNGGKVLGVVLDGIGYGDDGTLWGGELLLADYCAYRRVAAFDAVPLPGGEAANREPWRNAFAHLDRALGWGRVQGEFATLACIQRLQQKPLATLGTMIARGVNSPLSSSCGRLFDAAAALLGVCFDGVSYEGQAAQELEQLAAKRFATEQAYPLALCEQDGLPRVVWGAMWEALLRDLQSGAMPGVVAARFHHTVVAAVLSLLEGLVIEGVETVVLSGGAMQNRLISEGICTALQRRGVRTLLPRQFPANDGGVALGQAVIAVAQADAQ